MSTQGKDLRHESPDPLEIELMRWADDGGAVAPEIDHVQSSSSIPHLSSWSLSWCHCLSTSVCVQAE